MSRLARAVYVLLLIGAWKPASAQTWDNSGNSKLNGNFFFRQVLYAIGNQFGDIGQAAALYGTISFHGDGTYSIAASSVTYVDSANGSGFLPAITNGTYTISASGYGFMSNPYTSSATSTDFIYGLVSNGVFIGSSTDNNGGYNDLFIAAAASGATAATFKGSYSLAYMVFPFNASNFGDPGDAYDAIATLNPNGAGTVGTMNVTAYAASNGNTPFPGVETNVRYTFGSSGSGTLLIPFPAGSGIPGSQVLYISPDGNLIFGGSPGYWDMFVGVRTGAGTPSGLYYQAGLQDDASQVPANDSGTIYTYYGSLSATSSGAIVAHQRFFEPIFYGSQDYTYSDSFPAGTPGGYTDTSTSTQYQISGDGGILVGLGIGPFLGLNVALKAPPFSGSGVYLNPTGVQNAASFAPFTASVARGELLFLTGSGLADQFVAADIHSAFPTTLNGVQVLFNGVPAALYYVGPTFVAALVPYETSSAVVQIQVVNRGNASNTITAFVGSTAPGVYIANGYGIAQHTDYSLVSASNPAHPGDTLLVYMTGLGDVSPAITNGAVGPIPVSTTTNAFTVKIGGVDVTSTILTEYVPTIAGDYVLAVTVPTGVTTGDAFLTVSGPESIASTALLPVVSP